MQFIIRTKEDLKALQGKFVLQISKEDPYKTLMDFNWNFVKEKRLKLVSKMGFIDLYGERKDFETFENFKNFFNNYLFDHMIKENKTDGGRFHRLLTNRELDFLLQKIKEENY